MSDLNGANDSLESSNVPALRWQIPSVLLVSFLIAFFDRMNLSYALPQIAKDYGWTVKEIGQYGGWLMSAFYVAYGVGNIVISPYAARIGPRKSLIAVVFLFSVFTMISAPVGLVFSLFLLVRVLLGFSEAPHVPMMSMLTRTWFPSGERSRANAVWLAGLFLSMVLAPIVIVPIIEHWGWRSMYFFLGGAGLVVTAPLLYFFVYDSPEKHPRISDIEKNYIRLRLEQEDSEETDRRRDLAELAKNGRFWLALLCGTMNTMVAFGLFNWIPTYFTEGRNLEFSGLAFATSIPYSFSVIGLLFWAYMGDKTNKRTVIAGVGYLLGGVTTWFAATASTMPVVVALFSLTIFISVTWASNEYAIIQKIVPKEKVALGTGIYNGVAMIVGGGLGPVIIGQVVAATGNYTTGILSVTLLFFIGGLFMLLLARS